MKSMITLLILTLSGGASLQAQVMDMKTHDALIQKLEKGQDKKSTLSKDIELRLADLYADRARLKFISEQEKSCNHCLGSKTDRETALSKYLKLFEITSGTEQERVLIQIVQMNMLLDSQFRREAFFKKIIKGKNYGASLKARSTLALAEIRFQKGDFKQAQTYFKKAIALKKSLKTPLTQYRMAWCDLNLGRVGSAKSQLVALLKRPDAFKADPSLRSDMAQDLARFLAKNKLSRSDLDLLKSLSPGGEQKENLQLLASEYSRLGQPQSLAMVNDYLLKNFKSTTLEVARMSVELASTQYSQGSKTLASQTFVKAMNQFSTNQCRPQAACDELKNLSRQFVVNWRQDVKLKPTRRVVGLFAPYLSVFSKDFELAYWGGQMAEDLKMWKTAQKHFEKAAFVLHNTRSVKKNQKLMNASALSAIRVAENTKDVKARRQAYKAYLKVLPQGAKAYDSRYQLAFIDYEEGKNKLAKARFETLIDEFRKGKASGKREVARKGADLVLDILAQQRDNAAIMSASEDFGKLFSKKKLEYASIYRKAAYNQGSLDLKSGSQRRQKESMLRLKKISFRGVKEDEQIRLLKLQNGLAEKIKDLPEVDRTAVKLLKYASVDKATVQFARQQRIWVAETQMNFSRAYSLVLETVKGKPSKAQSLRLGSLLELAGRNPVSHYEAALKYKTGVLEGNQIRAKIVRASRAPWREIKQRLPQLKRSPKLLSELALETYTKYANVNGAEKVLAAGTVAKKPAGRALRRHLEIPRFVTLAKALSSHKISTRSDRRLQKDLTKRLGFFDEMNTMANGAIARGDIPIQLATLSVLETENQRLAGDLLSFPVPKGLNIAETRQYTAQIKKQAQSYQKTASEISTRLKALWESQTYITALVKENKTGTAIAKEIIAREAQFLLPYAPKNLQGRLRKLTEREKAMTKVTLKSMESKVKSQPFREKSLSQYRDMALYFGEQARVAYLDQRLLQLKKEKK